MPICKICSLSFPNWKTIEGKRKNLSKRKYCLNCSPFGEHNTRKLENPRPENIKQYYRSYFKQRLQILKLKVYEFLGGSVCCECGCNDLRILEINHIKGGGNKERKYSALQYYKKLLDIPKQELIEKYNILCRVCNANHYVRDILGINGFKVRFIP